MASPGASSAARNMLTVNIHSPHPFEEGVESQHLLPLPQNDLAMSQTFPYLQAGAQKDLIFAAIQNDQDVPMGISGLPRILETFKTFHANHLRRDVERLGARRGPSAAR
jgi:hypothetical protein